MFECECVEYRCICDLSLFVIFGGNIQATPFLQKPIKTNQSNFSTNQIFMSHHATWGIHFIAGISLGIKVHKILSNKERDDQSKWQGSQSNSEKCTLLFQSIINHHGMVEEPNSSKVINAGMSIIT